MIFDNNFNKYCYNCGKVIKKEETTCPYCKTNFIDYKKQRTVRCSYCRTLIPIDAKFCRVCNTKNIILKSKEDQVALEQLRLAADRYQQEKQGDKYVKWNISHLKMNFNMIKCYGKFEEAKKVHIRSNNEGLTIQTLEYGKDVLKYDEIICCHIMGKEELMSNFDLDVSEYFIDKFIVIETVKGFMILEEYEHCEHLVHNIYYHLRDKIVEFKNSFYNCDYEEKVLERYEKEAEI